MVQERPLLRTQYELLQIDGVAEEGEGGRNHRVGLADRPKILDDIDFEGMEEREWSRIDVREPLNIRPVVVHELKGPYLLSVGRKQCYGAGRIPAVGDYVQCGPFRAFEEGSHVDLALWKGHTRP